MTEDGPEDVGYGRPPRASRWKKGQSGNPRGGPGKRDRTLRQIAEDVIARTVMHQGRTLTYLDIILIQVANMASRGNKRARRLLDRIEKYQQATPEVWLTTRDLQKLIADEHERRMSAPRPPARMPDQIVGKNLAEIMDIYHRRIRAQRDDRDD